MNAKTEKPKDEMAKIKINLLLPWLAATGFALLFLSTLITKTPEKTPLSTQTAPVIQNQRTDQEVVQRSPEGAKETTVARAIDGDTIELADGTRVRYIGIDTPETGQCFGSEAAQENKRLVEGKKVKLETDVQKLDKYGRLLAYVFVDNLFVNEELVRQGFAKIYTYPPDIKYTEKFIAAQKEAREKEVGLWAQSACTGLTISSTLETSTQAPNQECTIKGNISSSGEKIYHVSGQRYYEKTKIEEHKGERWFCTEEEAVQAGWRKSKI